MASTRWASSPLAVLEQGQAPSAGRLPLPVPRSFLPPPELGWWPGHCRLRPRLPGPPSVCPGVSFSVSLGFEVMATQDDLISALVSIPSAKILFLNEVTFAGAGGERWDMSLGDNSTTTPRLFYWIFSLKTTLPWWHGALAGRAHGGCHTAALPVPATEGARPFSLWAHPLRRWVPASQRGRRGWMGGTCTGGVLLSAHSSF